MTTIKLKNGSGAPTAGDLAQGEPALDLTNKRLYTEDSGGTVIEVGTNPGTDVTFADNRKAIFGAGSDLQIYHDGSNSFISDTGTGNLFITGASNMYLQNGSSETFLDATTNGAVRLFYDNALKIETTSTGIDVTGTVTADGLTVDGNATINSASPILYLTESDTTNLNTRIRNAAGNYQIHTGNDALNSFTARMNISHSTGDISFYEDTGTTAKLFWDASAESLGIGTSSPAKALQVAGDVQIGESSGGEKLFFRGGSNKYNFMVGKQINVDNGFEITPSTSVDGMTFSNPAVVVKQDGNVGIGTSSPSKKLHILGSTITGATADTNTLLYLEQNANNSIQINSGASNNGQIRFGDASSNYRGAITYQHSDDSLQFVSAGSEAMRIDSSGQVGIGVTSISNPLHVYHATNNNLARFQSGDATAHIQFRDNSTTYIPSLGAVGDDLTFAVGNGAPERMRIDSSGRVGISRTPSISNSKLEVGGADNVSLINVEASGNTGGIGIGSTGLQFFHGSTAHMRLDSSGNLLVGTASTSGMGTTNRGVLLRTDGGAGAYIQIADLGTATKILAYFQNGNGTVGTISTSGSATTYNTSSDQRLKDNIVDAPSASDDIDAIQVRSFDWKVDGSHQKYGMVAQELQTVAPEAVTEGETEDDMMGVDYSKLVPMMLKEIQSLRARVAELENN
jgi:hypothetical protein